jgi:hypothetical protein
LGEKSEPVTAVTAVTPGAETSSSLQKRVAELLADDAPAPIDNLSIGEAQAITLCLLTGESLSNTCRLVFGGKNGRYMAAVKDVRQRLAGVLGAAA